jgi:hypothetical protein
LNYPKKRGEEMSEKRQGQKLKRVFQQEGRKPYQKPKLIKFGHVEKLTESGGHTHTDGMGTRRV